MLYRRHLRIKVLQALYAWYTGGSDDLKIGTIELQRSVNKLYELFIYQLAFLVEVNQFALKRIEEAKNKFYPTSEDLDPNLKFVENRAINLLAENNDFRKKRELFKVNWSDEQDLIRKFHKNLIKADFYKKYMSVSQRSLEEDKMLFIQVVDRLLPEDELLRSYYDEKSVYFTDGFDLVNLMLIKFFETFNRKFSVNTVLPGLYKNESGKTNEDLEFLLALYRKTILRDEENTLLLRSKTSNWDYDRIPLMDIILLKMAIIELQEMETIPVKVTLNEYIELAKYFSASKSTTFVNGVLDRLIREFNEEGRIRKSGRGLIG